MCPGAFKKLVQTVMLHIKSHLLPKNCQNVITMTGWLGMMISGSMLSGAMKAVFNFFHQLPKFEYIT
uniref:Uncharacterized protein n=1 Tax=Romanomermis culicivorax TaxID=13658 RepID=A0A915IEL0_ROMCU